MSGPTKRPHRSNSPLDIIRDIKTQKVIYWTVSRLQKLLPGVFSSAREDHFAKAREGTFNRALVYPKSGGRGSCTRAIKENGPAEQGRLSLAGYD